MMRTLLSWIQPHLYGAILRHLLNTVNSILYSTTNYFDNLLPPNDLIIVSYYGDDDEGEWDIKRVLERQEDAHIKADIQSYLEFQSLTLSPTRSTEPLLLHIDVHDAYKIGFRRSAYVWKEAEIDFPMAPFPSTNKIGFDQNCHNSLNIQSPTHPVAVDIKTDPQVAYDIKLRRS
jgi:hypothetical protein